MESASRWSHGWSVSFTVTSLSVETASTKLQRKWGIRPQGVILVPTGRRLVPQDSAHWLSTIHF